MSIGDNGRPVAAITGASSGFGKIYAKRLASEGYDLLLVARREEKLLETTKEIKQERDVEIETISADLSVLDDIIRVERRLESIPSLRYLINNAGFGGNQKFPDVFIDVETKMVLTHCLAPMRLCRAALVPMKAQGKKRDAGYIINVSSVSGFLAGEGAADYTATKAYLITFSKSLQCDVGRFGVRVQALCPGFARTGFHDAETMRYSNLKETVPNFLWQRADRVVDASLRSLRRPFRPNVVCIPTIVYKIAGYFGSSWLFAPLRILLSRGTIR
ncbi:MAG: SDR family NAD(P)-dependent oxidoreductase [Thermoguttaceae bacterium]|nr:SDR family NAD(P)-dependent oxidoreductase [Thermoguttaceae bacterium]